MNPNTLEMTRGEMQELATRVLNEVVEHFAELRGKSVTRIGTRAELEAALREPMPEHGQDAARVMERLRTQVWGSMMFSSHPRFFAFVPSPSNFVSAMADTLMVGYDAFAGTWLEGSGPAMIELVTTDWLREMCGLPKTAGGHFVSGGSAGNLTGLAVARHIHLNDDLENAVVYCSDQTHFSSLRAVWLLGFKPHQIENFPGDESYRLDVNALEKKIAQDRARGKRPFCVIANAGTTNTGAVDPLNEIADLCAREKLWLHVDGAYGAAAMLTPRGRAAMRGIERADSLALDPHKWLFQPYECGVMLVRENRWLRETFSMTPEYLSEAEGDEAQVNFFEEGLQLTRNFKALKLWFSIQVFGAAGFRAAIEHGIALAEYAEQILRASPVWEIVSPAQLGIVAFRHVRANATETELNLLNQSLVTKNMREGFSFLTATTLRGKVCLRLCPINPQVTEQDIVMTIARLEEIAARV